MRPGRLADVPTVTRLYMASFGKEPLLDYMFPTRHTDDTTFYTWTYRRFQARYWDQTYILTVVVDDGDRPVAFSWWERPAASLTFADRFLTPSESCPLISLYISSDFWSFWSNRKLASSGLGKSHRQELHLRARLSFPNPWYRSS